jgi:hypothetical protein
MAWEGSGREEFQSPWSIRGHRIAGYHGLRDSSDDGSSLVHKANSRVENRQSCVGPRSGVKKVFCQPQITGSPRRKMAAAGF